MTADLPRHIRTVNVWQLEVEDDDAGPYLLGQMQASDSIDRVLDLVAHAAEQKRERTSVVYVVFNDEDWML